VRAVPQADHVAQLTRPDATSSVHYVGLELTDVQVERFADSGATLFVDHPAYRAEAALTAGTRAALLSDLRQ
jgi:hypothetical protein